MLLPEPATVAPSRPPAAPGNPPSRPQAAPHPGGVHDQVAALSTSAEHEEVGHDRLAHVAVDRDLRAGGGAQRGLDVSAVARRE
jgi:hypothetical protein